MINKDDFVPGVCERAPERLLEDSLSVEGVVCATIFKDLVILDDCGLTVRDFITNHGRLLFGLAVSIRKKGFTVFDEITYNSNCDSATKERIDGLGGFIKLQKMAEVVKTENWDTYLDNLNKRNLWLVLYTKGFTILSEVTVTDSKGNPKQVIPYDALRDRTSTDILNFYESILAQLTTNIKASKIVDEGYIDFSDDYFKSLRDKEEVGVSIATAGYDVDGKEISVFPFMDKQILGLLPGTLNCWGAYSGCGKSTYMVSILMCLAAKGIKSIVVTNEMQLKQYKTFFLLFILTRYLNCFKINKRKLESGSFSEEEYQQYIVPAQKIWREKFANMIRVECLEDSDNTLTCQIFKKWILHEGCGAFLVDTYKLSFSGEVKDNSWMDIVKDTRDLASLASKYNVIGLMTVQLSPATMNRGYMDSSCLSNCKAMKEVMTNLILFRKATPEELDPTSPYYLHPFRSVYNEETKTWHDEPFEPDPKATWRVALIDKSRRGPDSTDLGGVGYLWKFTGDYGRFSESCKCRPVRKLLPGN